MGQGTGVGTRKQGTGNGKSARLQTFRISTSFRFDTREKLAESFRFYPSISIPPSGRPRSAAALKNPHGGLPDCRPRNQSGALSGERVDFRFQLRDLLAEGDDFGFELVEAFAVGGTESGG